MHSIERELIEATDYKTRKKFDDRQDYLKSILNAVMKLGDDDFDNLTDMTAAWANAAVEAYNSKSEIPDFDEASETEDDETEEVAEAEAEEADDPEDEADDEEADSEADEDDEVEEETEEASDMDETEPDPSDDEDVPVDEDDEEAEPEPVKPAKKAKAPSALKKAIANVPPPEKKTPKIKQPVPPQFTDDATLDKWGCIEGSKNSQALMMFEKGATTSEVKKAIGGTYYNILSKCVKNGHKLHKEGAIMTIIYKGTKKAEPKAPPKTESKAPAKPAKKAVVKKAKK